MIKYAGYLPLLCKGRRMHCCEEKWFSIILEYNGEEAYVYASYLSTTPAQDTTGHIWIVVSEGRNADGESAGLTYSQCARLLGEKGCIFGVPLDGGGSSTMVFQGKVLNSAKAGQRAVVDFVYFK